MKILHIINELNVAGAERLLTDMVPVQRSRGHEVELLLLNGKQTPLTQRLREKGFAVHSFALRGGEYNPLAIVKLRNYLRACDVVHVHLFPAQYWVAACKWLFGVKTPLVTTEHSTSNSRFNHWLTTVTDRWVYRRYRCIVGISEAVSRVMSERVGGRVATVTIENGIDLKTYAAAKPLAKASLGLPDDARVLMQVARFQQPKNQDCVIRALRLLPADVHAVFAGEGERMQACQSLAAQLGVAGRVHFLGLRSDVPRLYATADVGVVSSHWEGFGLAAVEAMATGIPVVASRVEGLAQVVGNSELCFADDDERQLASIVERLLGNADFHHAMAAYGKHRSEQYSIERMADEYLQLYEKSRSGNAIL